MARDSSTAKFKIVFLGDAATGKTSLINRLIYNEFNAAYETTIGVDFLSKTAMSSKGVPVRLQLWDTAGQERFRSLVPSYIRNTNFAILVFDVCDRDTFENINYWHSHVKQQSMVQTVMIGNKIDLNEQRVISFEEMERKKEELEITHVMEVSALTSEGVNNIIKWITRHLPETQAAPRKAIPMEKVVKKQVAESKRSWCCLNTESEHQ